jgi:glycosyltransferase involved in cell wall biosynthesis
MHTSSKEILSVCHIVSGDLWGGAEALVFHLLNELQKNRNLHLNVIIHNEGELCTRLRNVGVRVTVINEQKFNFFQLVLKARHLIQKENVEIIHSHRYKENCVAVFASRLSAKGFHLIQTVHGLSHPRPGVRISKMRLYAIIDAFFRRLFFDRVVVVSKDLFHTLAETGVSAKLRHISNGISLDSVNFSIVKGGGQSAVEKTIAVVGRLVRVKNVEVFLRAIPQMLLQRRDLNFLVVGDGPERKSLENLTEELGIEDHVEFMGHISDMASLWPKIDVYVLCSLHEGLSIALLEAMAHGIPVVATAVGGNTEVIQHDRNGFLVPNKSSDSIVRECLRILSLSEIEMQSLQFAAMKTVRERYSSTACAKRYVQLYQKFLN